MSVTNYCCTPAPTRTFVLRLILPCPAAAYTRSTTALCPTYALILFSLCRERRKHAQAGCLLSSQHINTTSAHAPHGVNLLDPARCVCVSVCVSACAWWVTADASYLILSHLLVALTEWCCFLALCGQDHNTNRQLPSWLVTVARDCMALPQRLPVCASHSHLALPVSVPSYPSSYPSRILPLILQE